MTVHSYINRRRFGCLLGAAALYLPDEARARYRDTSWDDLIPPGVPYAEIIGEGEMDEANDIWKPIYDANATRFNDGLDGKKIKLPGYVLPLEMSTDGLHEFILVPYIGACIHVPPPPPNQLVFVTTRKPWYADNLWDAVWVYGTLTTQAHSTAVAEIGYQLSASKIEIYEW